MRQFQLYWTPEGRPIAKVMAKDHADAISKTPAPHNQFPGEVLAVSRTEAAIERVRDAEAYGWSTRQFQRGVSHAAELDAEGEKRPFSYRRWFSTDIGPTTFNAEKLPAEGLHG